MKIELQLNNDTLMACNEILRALYASGTPAEQAGKLVKSIALEVADKFDSKCKSLVKKATLFDTKKKHKVSLKYHEAWGLYRVLCVQIDFVNNDYQVNLIRNLIGVLNQKLA